MSLHHPHPPHAPEGAKALLWGNALISGAAVMVVELAANRVLAPWFGNSLFTWTGLIGVIMVALSAGYYLGGWFADRWPKLSNLTWIMAGAALLVLAIAPLAYWLEHFFAGGDLIWGPILATLALFALPGMLLGSVAPFTIRMISLLSEDKAIGVSAGKVSMLSTLGSVLGTFLAGFWLIPSFELGQIFSWLGVLLMLLALACHFILRRRRPFPVLGGLLVGMLLLWGANQVLLAQPLPPGMLYQENSFYHRIRVGEQPTSEDYLRQLYLDTTPEGGQYKFSTATPTAYQRYWRLYQQVRPELKTALFLGGGAFQMPEEVLREYPNAKVDVVEIDPKVIEVGRIYFRLNEFPNLTPHAQDARRFVGQTQQKYDLIFGDAYQGLRNVPAHLLTQEFFQATKEALAEDGIYMMNLIGALQGEDAALFQAVALTLEQVYGSITVFSLRPSQPWAASNLILVAQKSGEPLNFDELSANPAMAELLSTKIPASQLDWRQAELLTDAKNPAEWLVAKSLLKAQR